ncbi:MAG: transporter substrate-binding domain-containing protein [Alphaproteobacteria bacterium]|nr:transporter substrate-binding domain-containing protein [Alphaproteobacteria bacterium]
MEQRPLARRQASARSAAWLALLVLPCALLAAPEPAAAGPTLDRIKQQGNFRCGTIRQAGTAVADLDPNGRWRGFFPDFCRAVATALTGNPDAVEIVQISGAERFRSLRSGDADLLVMNATLSLSDEAAHGVSYPAIYYYDSLAIMRGRNVRATTLRELAQAGPLRICTLSNTAGARTIDLLVATSHANLTTVPVQTHDGYLTAFRAQQCDLVAHHRLFLGLHVQRKDLGDAALLPDSLQSNAFSPMALDEDQAWLRLVRGVVQALILGEALDVSSANVQEMRGSADLQVRRLLGIEGAIGAAIGLPADWAARMIAAVGHYGEIFERNLGAGTPLRLERGPNRPWNKGGLLYAAPLQ